MTNKTFNIYTSRYTKESWIKTYGENTLNEWESLNCPNHINDFIIKIKNRIFAKKGNEKREPLLTIVPIDEEYFFWIKENNLKNTTINRKIYISKIVNEENANRLMKKNNWNVDYEIYGIPIIVETINKKNTYKLNKETIEKITIFFEKTYGKNNVLVFNNFVKCSDFFNNEILFVNAAKEYFCNNSYKEKKIVKLNQKEINEMVIPIAIRRTLDETLIDLKTYFKSPTFFEKELCLNKDFYEIEKMIKSCIKNKCYVKYGLSKINYIIESIDEFYDSLLTKGLLKNIEISKSSKVAKIKIKNLYNKKTY